MSMELNAQTVKWFNSSDELVDPLMSLGALAPSLKGRFSLSPSLSPLGGTGPVLGLEMEVLVLIVWMGSYLVR